MLNLLAWGITAVSSVTGLIGLTKFTHYTVLGYAHNLYMPSVGVAMPIVGAALNVTMLREGVAPYAVVVNVAIAVIIAVVAVIAFIKRSRPRF